MLLTTNINSKSIMSMLILALMYAQILISTKDENIDKITPRLLINENTEIENSSTNMQMKPKPFQLNYSELNEIDKELNDSFNDAVSLSYFHKNEDEHQNLFSENSKEPGYTLLSNDWQLFNLDLSTYTNHNFELKMDGNGIQINMRDKDIMAEKITKPKVGEWIWISKEMTLDMIWDLENMLTREIKTDRDLYLYVKQVGKLNNIIAGKIMSYNNEGPLGTEPKIGDYLIFDFNDIYKVLTTSKLVAIGKESDYIKLQSTDLFRNSSIGQSWRNTKTITATNLEHIAIKFYPNENKIILFHEDQEFATLNNPDHMSFSTLPFQYNLCFKTMEENYQRPLQLIKDIPQKLLEHEIFSYLNVKERIAVCFLSKWFQTELQEYLTKPFKIFYPTLNSIDIQLNDKFTENASSCYVHCRNRGGNCTTFSEERYIQGYTLKQMTWQVQNLNLENYGNKKFELKIFGNGIEFIIRDSDILDETITDPHVGDWIGFPKHHVMLNKIVDLENMETMEITEKIQKPLYIKQVNTEENEEVSSIIIGEINSCQSEVPLGTEPKNGDYLIFKETFDLIRKMVETSKQITIEKGNDGQIILKSIDLVRLTSFSQRHANTKTVTTNVATVTIEFYPIENKMTVLHNGEEFSTLLNPTHMQFTTRPFEYDHYFKTIFE